MSHAQERPPAIKVERLYPARQVAKPAARWLSTLANLRNAILILILIWIAGVFAHAFWLGLKPSRKQPGQKATSSFFQNVVSANAYSRITTGMSYRQVRSIIGSPGEEIARNHMDGVPGVMPSVVTTMYAWQNADGSNMNAMFQNDRLISKAQFGLR
jgi:hypothetical protein